MSDPFGNASAQTGSEFDPLFAGAEDAGITERQAGFEPLPPFPFYVFKVVKGMGNLSREKGTPSLRTNLEVVHGPTGTEGRRTGPLDVIYLTVNRESKKDGKMVVLSDTEFEQKKTEFFARYNRVKGVLGLAGYPANTKSLDALNAYMAPTEGRIIIGELRVEIGQDKQARNRLIAESLESPDAPRTATKNGKKVVVPGTALDEALEKIAEYNAKLAGGGTGTAGSRKGGGPF